MIRRWHHGHSLATGAAVGLAFASYRLWLLLALAFTLGAVCALVAPRLWQLGRRLVALIPDRREGWGSSPW